LEMTYHKVNKSVGGWFVVLSDMLPDVEHVQTCSPRQSLENGLGVALTKPAKLRNL
jgi:hypothetical protein